MAVKSKAVMLSDSNSTFANASNITAAEHRAFNLDLIDSYENFIGSYTTLQILAIASPTLRQIVFDTTLNVYYFWDGTRWVEWAAPRYKTYRALVTQTGTSAPTAIVLENSLGGTVSFNYVGVGTYTITSSSLFIDDKTFVTIQQTEGASGIGLCVVSIDNFLLPSTINLNVFDVVTQAPGNDRVRGAALEILVYY